jgi:probable rRNA maturation factor
VLTDDQKVQELNRDYRSLDEPTDVLSFQMDERDPETGELYFGDIVISIPTARSQAQTAGHSLIEELSLLVVHGTLHLLGFDHGNPVDQKRMWDIQTEILDSLGLDLVFPEQEY